MKKLDLKLYLFLLSTSILFNAKAQVFDDELIKSLKPAVVSINVRETMAAYGEPCNSCGTGFIDRDSGLVITNRHLASTTKVATYEARLSKNRIAKLNLLWNDPTRDIAVLKFEKPELLTGTPQVKFASEFTIGEEVCMIGNNLRHHQSVHYGSLIDNHDIITTDLPQQSLTASVNSKGGSSGSPLFNNKGQVIGLVYASDDVSAFAIPIHPILDILGSFLKKEIPNRQSTGAIFKTILIDHAESFYHYPQNEIQKHLAKIPDAQNRLLRVSSILPRTPAKEFLKPGDIIREVNGKKIGPDLYLLEKECNESAENSIELSVWRKGLDLEKGKSLHFKIPLFNLNNETCTQMVSFGNTIFTTVDILMSYQTGMPLGRVCVATKTQGSVFAGLPLIDNEPPLALLVEINQFSIKTLRDLINIIPNIINEKTFNFIYKNFGATFNKNVGLMTNQGEVSSWGEYNEGLYPPPEVITFESSRRDWVRELIPLDRELEFPQLQ